MELALLIALLVTNAAWLIHRERSDRRHLELEHLHRDQISELTTRLQHPALVNPRALEGPRPDLPDPVAQEELNELALAGGVFPDGVPGRAESENGDEAT